MPPDRWDLGRYYDPRAGIPGKTNACWGGFVNGIDKFDAAFFGISPREAARMDPQQRLMLEVAWEALEDGGLPLERLAGQQVAVYVGVSSYEYALIQNNNRDYTLVDTYANTGSAQSIVANRISYCFNLRGPSAAIDTACSSALVAVHLACVSLWSGESTMALAGGVNALVWPGGFIGFTRLSMLSPDGRCKAFDAGANGFVRSEGAGAVVLKPLARAVADGDRVYAVIRATGVNQDGRTGGMTVPSQSAQEELLRQTCRDGGIDPGKVQYAEAHGTGTLVGDPIEARALGSVLSVGRPDSDRCLVGSVKTNIGHLEPASGIAGLIKVALALHHRQIPPSLHFCQPNPAIPFDDLKLAVAVNLRTFPHGPEDGPAVATINSFGFGGTNANAVLEEMPRTTVRLNSPDLPETGRTRAGAAVGSECRGIASYGARIPRPAWPRRERCSARFQGSGVHGRRAPHASRPPSRPGCRVRGRIGRPVAGLCGRRGPGGRFVRAGAYGDTDRTVPAGVRVLWAGPAVVGHGTATHCPGADLPRRDPAL